MMKTFDKDLARLLLEVCRYTYADFFVSNEAYAQAATLFPGNNCDADRADALEWIKQSSYGPPSRQVLLINNAGVACVVSYPDKNIVSYMGSLVELNTPAGAIKSIVDWAENLVAVSVPFKLTPAQLGLDNGAAPAYPLSGRVHQGFMQQLGAIQASVVRELLKPANDGKNRPLYVTGYSQGGAVAALATPALLAAGFDVAATYTFAAPRPGDQAFADAVAARTVYRIEFGNDIVPHVPPRRVGANEQVIINAFLNSPFFPAHIESSVKQWLSSMLHEKTGYVGAGKLCYGCCTTRTLRAGITTKEEEDMFVVRLCGIIEHLGELAEHHLLAGDTHGLVIGKKYNYTALLSDFLLVP